MKVQEKRRFLKRFVALLEESALFWSYGFWDYIDDPETAAQEFNTWVNEIESSMATEEEELARRSTTCGAPRITKIMWSSRCCFCSMRPMLRPSR